MNVVRTNSKLNVVRNAIFHSGSKVALMSASVTLQSEVTLIRSKIKILLKALPKRTLLLRWMGPLVKTAKDFSLFKDYEVLVSELHHARELQSELHKAVTGRPAPSQISINSVFNYLSGRNFKN